MGGRTRRGGRRALLAVAALAVAAAAAWTGRRAAVEWLLLEALRSRSLVPASLRVEAVGPGGLVVRDLRIGDGDLALARLELAWSPAALGARRLDALRVRGLRIRGALDADGVRLGALDGLRGGGAAAEPGPPRFPVLPSARIEVEDANLVVDTAAGPSVFSLAIALDEAGDGRIAVSATELAALESALGIAAEPFAIGGAVSFRPERIELTLDPAPFALALAGAAAARWIVGETPRIEVAAAPGAGAGLRIATVGGRVAVPDAAVALEGIALEARLDPVSGLPTGSLAVAALRDTGGTPRFPPLDLRAELAPDDGALAFDGALAGLGDRLRLEIRGRHDPGEGTGRADLALAPLAFAAGDLGPRDLLPQLAPLLQSADGTVEARGELRWRGSELTGFMDFGLRDLTLRTRAALVDRLNAAVRVEGPWPPRMPPGQSVSMARLDFGLELTNGLVRYALRDPGLLVIEAAEWEFAGGTIRSGGALDLAAEEQRLTLTVRDVDLAELLALVNLDGLTGTGRLNGAIPLILRPGSIEIRQAVLEAPAAGGWIRYQPEGEATALASAAGIAFDDLLQALRDFRYEQLRLTVNGHSEGDVEVAVALLGANPAHRDGQPYEFNLNVDGRLGDLVRQSGAAYRIPRQIQEKLEAIAAGAQVGRAPGGGPAPATSGPARGAGRRRGRGIRSRP